MRRNKFLDFIGGLIGVIILLAIIAVIVYFTVEPFAVWVDDNIINAFINRTAVPNDELNYLNYLNFS